MIIHVNPASGIPIYMQLMEQVKHAIETGALRAGEQLPPLRRLAEELVINPNTVVRAYRELEYEGVVEIRHGAGAFVCQPAAGHTRVSRKAQSIMESAVERLAAAGLTEDAIRRLLENELAQLKQGAMEEKNMTECAIEAVGLRKSFKGHEALCGLNLSVPRGSVFGFLGRNGAGKTTTIRILMGLAKADQGAARVFGIASGDDNSGALLRRRIGFVPEDKELYPYMTVEGIIRFSRPFFPQWRDDLERRYLEVFELPPKKKIPELSKGMRSKLALLLAIARGSELLILDEPTDGLDPVVAEAVLRELIMLSASDGTTIFFSSHQLEEVEQIADRITIIDKGRAIISGELDDLKRQYQRIKIVFADGVPADIHWAQGAERIRKEGRMVSILAGQNGEEIMAQARSLPGTSVETYPVPLRELFLDLMRAD